MWLFCSHKLLQNENSELLKQFQPATAASGVDDSRLAQELDNKNKQVEVATVWTNKDIAKWTAWTMKEG